jgi:hypothetical protein
MHELVFHRQQALTGDRLVHRGGYDEATLIEVPAG